LVCRFIHPSFLLISTCAYNPTEAPWATSEAGAACNPPPFNRENPVIYMKVIVMVRQFASLGLRGAVLLAMLGLGGSPAQATKYWKNSVVTGNWSTDNNWSSTTAGSADIGGEI
jgi:hypothetical protein